MSATIAHPAQAPERDVTVAALVEDRIVDGVFAVARKRRLRTRAGRPYLAVELADRTGTVEGRVWSDVELLDSRFREGDAVRVLARVERFRDRLQLDVRSLEGADVDAASLTPGARRDLDELDGFFDFLADELVHPGLRELVAAFAGEPRFRERLRALPATADGHHRYAGGLLEHTVAVATICREASELHRRLRRDLLVAAALLHDAGRTRELGAGPLFAPTIEGALLGHVHLGLRLIEERAGSLAAELRAELLHAVSVHHDSRGARTAEAAVLFHANQLDAVAATRPVETP
ncbi:MAG: OB-fold nucleic acid binding domain-containing protein [Actinomycetota bacterium]|nr:OB-fold nucleic acid binding domain-containing protein [Actinomycetota bacterium]